MHITFRRRAESPVLAMVFVYNGDTQPIIIGLNLVRGSYKYIGMLIAESFCGLIVAISNAVVTFVLIIGWKTLVRNKFFVVLANLIVCTSLKAFVEIVFIVPYYIMQSDSFRKLDSGFFSRRYELIIFNVSVLADYGVLFFSLLIAINRLLTVSKSMTSWQLQGPAPNDNRLLQTAGSCAIVWLCAAVIPVLFYTFDCQYVYKREIGLYTTKCYGSEGLVAEIHRTTQQYIIYILIRCLIYLSYACTIVVLVIYLLILHMLSKKRRMMQIGGTRSNLSRAQMQILWQSLLVFTLYAASILCIFALSNIQSNYDNPTFDIAYTENLLNLSIAAVYPICFLVMSGDLKKVLIDFVFRRSYSTSVQMSTTYDAIILGAIVDREYKYVVQQIIEAMCSLFVAFCNAILIFILVVESKSLMKNKFYVILANLIFCTSMKAFVELAFILPYYIMQNEKAKKTAGYFTRNYELLIFNASVLADYGVLFFSVLIAFNQLVSVSKSTRTWQPQHESADGKRTFLACAVVWLCAAIIPILFYLFECQYVYEKSLGLYSNQCRGAGAIGEDQDRDNKQQFIYVVLKCLIYLSYVCVGIVLLLYLFILGFLAKQRRAMQLDETRLMLSRTQQRILWQSFVVFALYSASIFRVFALSFVKLDPHDFLVPFAIVYAENLLNLSIAAAYPVCFLVTSGEIRSILVRRLTRRGRSGASSVRVNSIAMNAVV
ncbi:hypothetical protein PRIPAC_81520 [Pristionchus pacificus]|uniref:Uncharacterized protein n=1 Tax=Pristionchus pacificus TaxID=54126 RepID=A0A2A6CPE2_PRIPA|nr:hypothetical protein PRIPAC_81520 [Pristionchus pacificus]|eukprot:PDM79923.1 hypothetical protein PRIPAC_32502 [Pristionchus pacificus]